MAAQDGYPRAMIPQRTWTNKNSISLGSHFRAGYEEQLLDTMKYDSVVAALAALNSGEVEYQSFCFVLSRRKKGYYMLWPSAKTKKEVDEFVFRYVSSPVSTIVEDFTTSTMGSVCPTPVSCMSRDISWDNMGVAERLMPLAEAQAMTIEEFPLAQSDAEAVSDPSEKTKKEVDESAERSSSSPVSIEDKVNLCGVQVKDGLYSSILSEVSTFNSTPQRTTTTTVARCMSGASESSTATRFASDGDRNSDGDGDRKAMVLAVTTKESPLWIYKNSASVGKYFRAGYEQQLLDKHLYDSVSHALAGLNSGEVDCQSFCFVLSRRKKGYFMLWPLWKTTKEVNEFAQRYCSSPVSTLVVEDFTASVASSRCSSCSTPRSTCRLDVEGFDNVAFASKLIPLAEAQTMTIEEDQNDVETISDPSGKNKEEVDESANHFFPSPVSIEDKVNPIGVKAKEGLDSSFLCEVSTTDSTPERATTDAKNVSRSQESSTSVASIGDGDTIAVATKEIPLWIYKNSLSVGKCFRAGYEAQLLDVLKYDSVTTSLTALNCGEVDWQSFCFVFSRSRRAFYLLWPSGKTKKEVDEFAKRYCSSPLCTVESVNLNGIQGKDGLDRSSPANRKIMMAKDQREIKVIFSFFQRSVEAISKPSLEIEKAVSESAERYSSSPVSIEDKVNLSGVQGRDGLDTSFVSEVSTTDSTPEHATTDAKNVSRSEESSPSVASIGDGDTIAVATKEIPQAEAQTMTMEELPLDQSDVEVVLDSSEKTKKKADEFAERLISEVSATDSTPECTTTLGSDESSASCASSGDEDTIAVAAEEIPLVDARTMTVEEASLDQTDVGVIADLSGQTKEVDECTERCCSSLVSKEEIPQEHWINKNSLSVGRYFRAGYEQRILDTLKYDSVSAALAALSSGEVDCQSFCFVFSRSRNGFYMLWPSWKTKEEVDEFVKRYCSSPVSAEVEECYVNQSDVEVISDPCEKIEKERETFTEDDDADTLAVVTKEIPMAEVRTMTIEELSLDQSDFDPNRAQLKAKLLKELGLTCADIDKVEAANAGSFNDGLWTVSDPTTTGFVLKLVPHSRGEGGKTDREKYLELQRRCPHIVAEFSLTFPVKILKLREPSGAINQDLIVMRQALGMQLTHYMWNKVNIGQSSDLPSIFHDFGKFIKSVHMNYRAKNRSMQHGDCQPSNVFYDDVSRLFTLVDVADFGFGPFLAKGGEYDVLHFVDGLYLLTPWFGKALIEDCALFFRMGYCVDADERLVSIQSRPLARIDSCNSLLEEGEEEEDDE
jgi:endonuclease YncB( thermonuclease family)